MYTPVPFLLPIVNKTVKMLFVIQHLPRWRQRLLCYLPCRSQLSMAAAPSFLAPPFSPPPPQSPLSPTRTCLHWLRVWKVKVIPWVKALMVSDSRAFPRSWLVSRPVLTKSPATRGHDCESKTEIWLGNEPSVSFAPFAGQLSPLSTSPPPQQGVPVLVLFPIRQTVGSLWGSNDGHYSDLTTSSAVWKEAI